MDKELKCPKCGSEKRVKSSFNNKKQRNLCKKCGHHYTVERTVRQHTGKRKLELRRD